MSAERNYTHVDFDRMECPHPGCESGKGKVPQTGTVPGIKRHVKLVHGQEVYDKIDWPAIRSTEGPIAKLTKEQLQAAAASRHIKGSEHMNKSDLIQALTA